MVIAWDSETWEEARHVNGKAIRNFPLNTEAVRRELAQKICTALFNNYDGLEARIIFAGTEGDTEHRYYVQLCKALTTPKMNELRAFVKGYMVCARSFSS